ncbi:bisdemethoxycurcumin synthase-like [Triticum dicoccoides]|uniref:bisdemethoxycurcumin synthase-like n=1 Tax=Triticum dicoccoides TaxID=85692 RepID=UPI00188F586E|nr:bisdemethoxycurcumin synthase-like [Triticum dicoccoides]
MELGVTGKEPCREAMLGGRAGVKEKIFTAFGKDTSAACVEDSDDSDGDPFVPNDFAEDDPFQASKEGQMVDPDLEKALYEFYMSHVVLHFIQFRLSGSAIEYDRSRRKASITSSSSIPAVTLGEIRVAQCADGLAAMLAIGTENPSHCLPQGNYPDYYFRVTNSDQLIDLKQTFAKLCGMTGISMCFFQHIDELRATHPDLSLNATLEVMATAPELAASAAMNTIAEWGCTAGDITHLVVSTNAGSHALGTDVRLVSLGLCHDVLRN